MEHRIADLLVVVVAAAGSASFAQAPPGSAAPSTAETSRTPAATTPASKALAPPATSTGSAAGTAVAPGTADAQHPVNAGSAPGAGPGTNVRIGRVLLGSGEPGGGPGTAYENATQVYNNLFHAPQYMPFFPTAATIWPRVIEVPCRQSGADLVCDRYFWRPEYGRGEYLFFTPIVQSAAASGPAGTAPSATQGK